MTDAAAYDSHRGVDRQVVLGRLITAIDIDKPACNVLLAGPWGSGKTTLLQDLKNALKEKSAASDQSPQEPATSEPVARRRPLWPVGSLAEPFRSLTELFGRSPPDDPGGHGNSGAGALRGYYVIEFSPWNQLGNEDPRDGFLKLLASTVLALDDRHGKLPGGRTSELRGIWTAVCAIAKDFEKELKKQVEKHVPYGDSAWVLGKFICALANQEAFLKRQRQAASAAATPVAELLRIKMYGLLRGIQAITGKKRILLLVDDLDRTRPEYAVSTLESLYQLMMPRERERGARDPDAPPAGTQAQDDDWPLTSVWAVNIAMLGEFLYAHYRDQPSFDATAYLEKLFHQRINVPPLSHSDVASMGPATAGPAEPSGQTGVGTPAPIDAGSTGRPPPYARGPVALWARDLDKHRAAFAKHLSDPAALAHLADQLNYAVLGNLRLHAAVRALCIQYWTSKWKDCQDAKAKPDDPFTHERLVRDARLMTLIQAFPGFREDIALYSGMWPEFINRVNERHRRVSFEAVRNPAYRHVDDPNLLTLLMDLEVLVWDERAGLYRLDRQGEERLTHDLGELLRAGF